jgi:hypothetical protein
MQTLDLSECKGLTWLPEGVSALTALQTLNLTWCTGLTGLPEGLSALTALQTLILGGCDRLTGLPEGLSSLTALQTLDLEECSGPLAEAVEGIDPLKEAQELMDRLQRSRSIFEVDVYAQPSFQSFSDSLLSALEKNVRALLFSGHGQSHCGFFWLKDKVSAEYEEIEPDRFVKLFPPVAAGAGGTIECVVMNACETYEIGKKLRKAGVLYVVCWLSEVEDTTATEFSVNFFTALDQSNVTKNMDYKLAFQQAVARMGSGGGAARAPMTHLAAGAVDYVCFLSHDGHDEFPDTGYNQGKGEYEESRSMNNDKGKFETESFRHLGFVLEYNGKSINDCIEDHGTGKLTASQVRAYGLEEKKQRGRKLLYLLPWAVKQIFDDKGRFGVQSYTDKTLWGDRGPIYDKAQRVDLPSLEMAIKSLKASLAMRQLHPGDSGHDFILANIQDCVTALEECYERRDLADTLEKELCALKELGFDLAYQGCSIGAGVTLYQQGQLMAVDVGTYGLEIQVNHGGKFLCLSNAAVKRLFGADVSSYADRKLWQKMGPIYKKAETAVAENGPDLQKGRAGGNSQPQHLRVDPTDGKAYSLDSFLECYGQVEGQRRWASAAQQDQLKNAIDFFKSSLTKRSAGVNSEHDFMRAKIEVCVTALEELADTSVLLGGLCLTGASSET